SAHNSFQCPCVQTSQSTCQQFDKKYQVRLLYQVGEKVMQDFQIFDYEIPRLLLPPDGSCETEECETCRQLLQHRLHQMGLYEPSPLDRFLSADLTNKTCKRYRFSAPEDTTRKLLQSFYYVLRHETLRYPQGAFDFGVLNAYAIFELRMMEIQRIM
ncbi:hypothetical protein PMAYCL1PPCAC_20220, partial [Pristionchus mayeri]